MNKSRLREYFSKELGWGWRREYESRAVFAFLVNAAELYENGVILDAGAGRKRYEPFFQDCIYISQEHEQGINFKGMQDVSYDLVGPLDERIPLKDNSVDGILSSSVIEHLRHPERFFEEAFRVLVPGGRLFVIVPFCIAEHEVPFDFNRPTRFGLKLWFESAGFQEITINAGSSSTKTICTLFPKAVREDMLRCCHITSRDILAASRKQGWHVAILTALHFVYIRIVMILVKVFCYGIALLVDRGPYDTVSLTDGWIAVATKPGKYIKRNFKDKTEFMQAQKI